MFSILVLCLIFWTGEVRGQLLYDWKTPLVTRDLITRADQAPYTSPPEAVAKQTISNGGDPCTWKQGTCGIAPTTYATESRDLGVFTVEGYSHALDLLESVLSKVRRDRPDLYAILSTAGMLCCRCIKGVDGICKSSYSNHAFGAAIDLKLGGVLDVYGDGYTLKGLWELYPFFHEAGFFWGATYNTEDSMHMEISREVMEKWQSGDYGMPEVLPVPPKLTGSLMCLKSSMNARRSIGGPARTILPAGTRMYPVTDPIPDPKGNYMYQGFEYEGFIVYMAIREGWVEICEDQSMGESSGDDGSDWGADFDFDFFPEPEQSEERERGTIMCFNRYVRARAGPGTDFEIVTVWQTGSVLERVKGPEIHGSYEWSSFMFHGQEVWSANAGDWYVPCQDQSLDVEFAIAPDVDDTPGQLQNDATPVGAAAVVAVVTALTASLL